MKTIFTCLFSFILFSLNSQECFTNFDYFRSVTLKASAADSIIDAHTVAIPINTKALFDAQKLLSNAADFRVTDAACNELPFFINDVEERDRNILYVSLPDIDEAGMSIQLYYGDSSVTESKINGNDVFEFFDDFEDGVVDSNKWEAIGAHTEWSEMDGEMRFTGVFGNGGAFQYVTPRMGFDDPMTYDFIANANNSQIYGFSDTEDRNRVAPRYSTGAQSFDTLDIIALLQDTFNGGTSPGIAYPLVKVPRRDMNLISMSGFLNTNRRLILTRFENITTDGKNLDTLLLDQFEFESLRPFFASFSTPIRIEFIGIRPAIQAYPIIEFGNEQMIGTSGTVATAIDLGVQLYPNPVHHWLRLKVEDQKPKTTTILNLTGQIVYNRPFTNSIDLSSFPSGTYILELLYNDGQRSLDRIVRMD